MKNAPHDPRVPNEGGSFNSLSRREVVTGIASLGASALACAPAAKAAGDPAVDAGFRRGVSLWPWFALTREFPPPSRGYAWPPFERNRPLPSAEDLARLRRAGFDFVRLPVDPGPFLALTGSERSQLMMLLEAAVDAILAADLAVVVDLHPNEATHFWNGRQLLDQGPGGSFGLFTGLAVDVAAMLSDRRARAALELVNEPPPACTSTLWQEQQKLLLAAVRRKDAELRIVLTGACGSLPEGLVALAPPEPRDDKLIYTFHYYRPYLFSHQGAVWMRKEAYYRYLREVPWPAAAGSRDRTMAAFRAQVDADPALSLVERAALVTTGTFKIARYFESDAGKSYVERHFAQIAAWREAHGIEAGRILLGEFGATKFAPPADRARYVADVRSSAEAQGFAWAFWNMFDAMGLVRDDDSHAFDASIVQALGLRAPAGDR